MLDFGIDCQQSADEFILTDRRYDEGHGAFHDLAVGESDRQPVRQRGCRRRQYTFGRLYLLYLCDRVGLRNEECIYNQFVAVNPARIIKKIEPQEK